MAVMEYGRSMTAASDRLLHDLETILAVSRSMGSERRLERLLDLICSAVTDLIHAERTSLFLVDRERGELWSTVAQNSTAIRLPMGSGIAGSVATSGKVINIPSAYEDARFNPDNDRRSGFTTRSILCMPLVNYSGAVVGVIQALNKRDGTAFGAYDEQVLSALCSQAGVAIDNTQLVAADLERQRLESELAIAADIQSGLLPDTAPEVPGWAFAAFAKPCDETGGDYFDYLPRPGGVDVVVGDVTGHGIGAALLMSTARAFLRALHSVHAGDLGDVVTRLNVLLERDMADDTFLSLAMCRLGEGGALAYVAAGHEAPLVWRAASRTFDVLDSTGLLLGLIDSEIYSESTLPVLHPGDLVLLFTDGLWECSNAAGEAFGLERLRGIVAEAAPRGAAGVRDALVMASLAHLGGTAATDDLTLVVVERC